MLLSHEKCRDENGCYNGKASRWFCDVAESLYKTRQHYSNNSNGMIEKGIIKVSKDGIVWNSFEYFEFWNLINDPVTRPHQFKKEITTRYKRVETIVIAGEVNSAAIAELDFFE